MKKTTVMIGALVIVCGIIFISIWGPERLTEYKDKSVLNQPHTEIIETPGAGYRYTLSNNEKLYILSKSLNSQSAPGSDEHALVKSEIAGLEYPDVEYGDMGTYAFIINHKGPSGKEITDEEIYETTNQGLEVLKELGVLPDSLKEIDPYSYETTLYSAIDVLEPRNNVSVWKISLAGNQKNRKNRLMDAYIDADDGRIYEFYVRTSMTWDEIDPDEIVTKWSEYMELSTPSPYENENPLLETATYYKKYVISGIGDEFTIVTIGYYEGVGEFFLKISK